MPQPFLRPDNKASVSQFVRDCFSINANHRKELGIDSRMDRNLRLRKGKYSSEEKALFGQYAPYLNVVEVKCTDFEAAFEDVQFNIHKKPWTIEPTPEPELPFTVKRQVAIMVIEQIGAVFNGQISRESLVELIRGYKDTATKFIKKEAKKGAARMERKIFDFLSQTDWNSNYSDFISDLATYPNAFLMSPVNIVKKTLKWRRDLLVHGKETMPAARRVSPIYVFPSPNSTNTQDGDNIVVVKPLSLKDLTEAKNSPGFNKKEIQELLDEAELQKTFSWWSWPRTRATEETVAAETLVATESLNSIFLSTNNSYALIYYGGLTGRQLKAINVKSASGVTVKDDEYYESEIWVAGDHVIRALLNPDPRGIRPIHSTSFRKRSGHFWGEAPPDLLYDLQLDINTFKRAHMTNVRFMAEPITEIDSSRFNKDDMPGDVQPGDTIYTRMDPVFTNGRAVNMYNVPDNAATIQATLIMHYRLADDIVGIPSQLTGASDLPSVNRTASVFVSSVNNALKKVKKIGKNIDEDVIVPVIDGMYTMLMMFSDDDSIKYDAKTVASGSQGIVEREVMQGQIGLVLQNVIEGIKLNLIPADLYYVVIRQLFANFGTDVGDLLPDPTRDKELSALGLLPQASVAAGQLTQTSQPGAEVPNLDGRSPVPQGQ
jgi:hypothetical protein